MSILLDIHKKIGEFSLDIEFQSQSRRIGILGASGCGKSMTLKCIAGIETPDQGLIRMDEHILYDFQQKINPKPQKRNVGYLFQNYALFPTMTVRENIGTGLKLKKNQKKARVDEMIEKFQLQGLEDRLPMELSGGQQQRVALARIMAYEPDVILLDEPFSALDLYLKDRLQHELLQMLEDYDGTVIMVSHSRDEIYRFSEDLLIMDQGKNVCFGPTKDIFKAPQKKEAARLTGCKNIVACQLLDRHRLFIEDWDIILEVSQKIDQSVRWIGVRAHDFIPIWGEKTKNCLPVIEARVDELPFEKKCFFKSKKCMTEEICWFAQREMWDDLEKKGMPDYLQIEEDSILLLE